MLNWVTPLLFRFTAGLIRRFRCVRGQAKRIRRQLSIYRASRVIVTPFTGFILSDHYLSSEIDELALNWLNRRTRSFRGGRAKYDKCRFVFCQVDQLQEFADIYLPKIESKFVLLTGKWGLPGLKLSATVHEILNHPLVVYWFSQNQVFRELSIAPFPYGVEVRAAPAVVREARRARKKSVHSRSKILFIPHSSIHPHLEGASRRFRESMSGVMKHKMSHGEYLSEIARHLMVLSPGGDRPDTYRHWECIALGSVPVSNLEAELTPLFLNNMRYIRSVSEALRLESPTELASDLLWRFDTWKKTVKSAREESRME